MNTWVVQLFTVWCTCLLPQRMRSQYECIHKSVLSCVIIKLYHCMVCMIANKGPRDPTFKTHKKNSWGQIFNNNDILTDPILNLQTPIGIVHVVGQWTSAECDIISIYTNKEVWTWSRICMPTAGHWIALCALGHMASSKVVLNKEYTYCFGL